LFTCYYFKTSLFGIDLRGSSSLAAGFGNLDIDLGSFGLYISGFG